jgi:hypothetical protein
MISLKFVSMTILLAGMTDCTTVQSRHPLADEHNTMFEPGLVGDWADANSGAEDLPLTIQSNGGSAYTITAREKDGSKPLESFIFDANTVRLGGQLFLDAQLRAIQVGDDQVPVSDWTVPAHWIARVQLANDTLVFELLDGDHMIDWIANHERALESDTADGTMLLISPTADLQKFIATNASDAWLFSLATEPLRRVVKPAFVP